MKNGGFEVWQYEEVGNPNQLFLKGRISTSGSISAIDLKVILNGFGKFIFFVSTLLIIALMIFLPTAQGQVGLLDVLLAMMAILVPSILVHFILRIEAKAEINHLHALLTKELNRMML